MDLLVTGASGYVGGRLVPRLLTDGHRVRCLVRDTDRLDTPWRDDVEVVAGAIEDEGAVLRAGDGADAAYFLVHDLVGRLGDLAARERAIAAAFREGAAVAGVGRIVYLGGLVDEARLSRTSEHLYARQQAGQELRDGTVPVTELRAGIVIGAGSASFELLLAAARSGLRVDAPWSRSRTQPIAEADLLDLLVRVLDDPRAAWEVLEVGGPDVRTYAELVAEVRAGLGLPPARGLPVPYLPTELAGTVAALATGMDPGLAVSLLRSAEVDAVVGDDRVAALYPDAARTPLRAAITAALSG